MNCKNIWTKPDCGCCSCKQFYLFRCEPYAKHLLNNRKRRTHTHTHTWFELVKCIFVCQMQAIRLYASVEFQNGYLNDFKIVQIHWLFFSPYLVSFSLSVFLRFASVDFYHVYHALQKCKFSAMESFGFWVVEKCATISHPWHEMLSASSYVLKMMLLEKCMTSHKMSLFFSHLSWQSKMKKMLRISRCFLKKNIFERMRNIIVEICITWVGLFSLSFSCSSCS